MALRYPARSHPGRSARTSHSRQRAQHRPPAVPLRNSLRSQAARTSDPSQSAYNENQTFARRCVDELGYVALPAPPAGLRRSTSSSCGRDSLQSDPRDPLDPEFCLVLDLGKARPRGQDLGRRPQSLGILGHDHTACPRGRRQSRVAPCQPEGWAAAWLLCQRQPDDIRSGRCSLPAPTT